MAYTNDFAAKITALITSIAAGEKARFSEMLYKATYGVSSLADNHVIVPGVRQGTVLPLLIDNPNPNSFPFKDLTGNCDIADCTVTDNFDGHAWDLGLLECRLELCVRTFDADFLAFFNQFRHTYAGDNRADELINSAMIQFMVDRFSRDLMLASWRAAYFGDKSDATSLLNGIDGFFAQLEASGGASHVTITENSEATYALQMSELTGEDVYNYLAAMYEEATNTAWFDDTQAEFRVTRSMGLKLVNYLNSMGDKSPNNCSCIDPATATGSRSFSTVGLRFNGIPVFVESELDTIINGVASLNGGGGASARVRPHRAILTYPQNLLIGTTTLDALDNFDVWYSRDDKKVYIEGSSYVGAGVPFPSQAVYAY